LKNANIAQRLFITDPVENRDGYTCESVGGGEERTVLREGRGEGFQEPFQKKTLK